MGNHGGRGKEGHPRNFDFDAHKAEALGFHVDPPDPIEAQVTYIAGDRLLFKDESLNKDLKALHPEMDDAAIQGLVGRVQSLRNPQQAESPKKP